jgi:KaiC/GvpD/RAD55 family RecA-like ATPase
MSVRHVELPPGQSGEKDPNDYRDRPEVLEKITDPMGWVDGFTLNDAEVAELKSPEWIIQDLVIRGHLIIVVAEPNGGKTTIFSHLAGEMVSKGYRVFYVNADISGSDAAHFIQQSRKGGWVALLPDLKPGLSMNDVIDNLKKMNASTDPLDDVVLVFDTLKKMTDVISKKSVKELLNLLRSLTGKGVTIILLGHTNKYKDADGKPVYEGTGDVRSDPDELIYLIPQQHDDKSMTVSTDPSAKVRGDFKPITFNISRDRQVTRAGEYVDTFALRKAQAQYEIDAPEIEVITQALEAGSLKQSEIVEFCKGHRIGKRTTLRLLNTYAKGHYQRWVKERTFQHNAITYRAISPN